MKKTRIETSHKELRRVPTGKLLPCPGEAHSNLYIDNCMLCMPRWGQIEELAPIDLAEARREGLAVRLGDLTDEQWVEIQALIASGAARREEAWEVKRNARGAVLVESHYFVAVFS